MESNGIRPSVSGCVPPPKVPTVHPGCRRCQNSLPSSHLDFAFARKLYLQKSLTGNFTDCSCSSLAIMPEGEESASHLACQRRSSLLSSFPSCLPALLSCFYTPRPSVSMSPFRPPSHLAGNPQMLPASWSLHLKARNTRARIPVTQRGTIMNSRWYHPEAPTPHSPGAVFF